MLTLSSANLPEAVTKIADPPKRLYVASSNWQDLLSRPTIAIIGSRKVTAYGRSVTATLAGKLAGSGVVIVSGLALGVDAIAHRAALEAGGLTIAVLPGSLDRIYPACHRNLAGRIVEQGGALITEYSPDTHIYPSNFIARNRLVSALSRAVLVTEAAEKSGTLHTARFALEQGKDVLAVPGNITSPLSGGTNNLIKAGAVPVTSVDDVLHYLGIHAVSRARHTGGTPQEQVILDLLSQGIIEGSQLLEQSGLEVSPFNQSLTMLEITGKVRCLGGNQWALQ
ncbi:MAG TPA: DNA-processing protein DprA [Candidatus Saccharimonadales bacterium]|nr:DNA-processing protein DprA [Candidatus Saccharimonadales bacterium]